jgi:hypothetical protein
MNPRLWDMHDGLYTWVTLRYPQVNIIWFGLMTTQMNYWGHKMNGHFVTWLRRQYNDLKRSWEQCKQQTQLETTSETIHWWDTMNLEWLLHHYEMMNKENTQIACMNKVHTMNMRYSLSNSAAEIHCAVCKTTDVLAWCIQARRWKEEEWHCQVMLT